MKSGFASQKLYQLKHRVAESIGCIKATTARHLFFEAFYKVLLHLFTRPPKSTDQQVTDWKAWIQLVTV